MKSRNSVYPYLLCALFAALTAVCSQIMIPLPFTPVPINLALLAVFTCGGVLGAKKGAVAMFVYILLGIIGAPVFVGFSGGLGVLAGPTGGYIIGYLPAAVVFGLLRRDRTVPRGGGVMQAASGSPAADNNTKRTAPDVFRSPAADNNTKRTVPDVFRSPAADNNTKRTVPAVFNIVLAIVRGVPAMLACYALGTAWFMALTGTGFAAALLMCVVPFIPGDLLKVAGAGAVCEALLRYTRTRGRGG